jgi:hypothetical protein
LLTSGTDHFATKQHRKHTARAGLETTFMFVARPWECRWKSFNFPHHANYALRQLEADILTEIGKRPISHLTAPILLAVAVADGEGVTSDAVVWAWAMPTNAIWRTTAMDRTSRLALPRNAQAPARRAPSHLFFFAITVASLKYVCCLVRFSNLFGQVIDVPHPIYRPLHRSC